MKRIIAVILLCFMISSTAACSADRNAIYDDDVKIASSGDIHFSTMSATSIKNNELLMTARIFSGAKTIWSYKAESNCDITLSILLTGGEGGRVKLVLITPDNEVIVLAESIDGDTADEAQTHTISIKKGSNRIKLVGYGEPSISLTLNVDAGRLVN